MIRKTKIVSCSLQLVRPSSVSSIHYCTLHISVSLECQCYGTGTMSCTTLNGICECDDGYRGYNCEDCSALYIKDDNGICQGK